MENLRSFLHILQIIKFYLISYREVYSQMCNFLFQNTEIELKGLAAGKLRQTHSSMYNRFLFINARKRSSGQGNIFTPVCQSFCSHGEGVVPGQVRPGPGTLPWDQVHPRDHVHPLGPGAPPPLTPRTRYTPSGQVHPQARYTPPGPGTPPG